MSHCILWVTASLLFTTANHPPVQVDGFGKQTSLQAALRCEASGSHADQTAPGPLSNRAATEAHLPVIQPWRKPPLGTQLSQDAPDGEQQAFLERSNEPIPKPALSPGAASGTEGRQAAIGQPGTNHYFLPPHSSPALLLSADHLILDNPTPAKQLVTSRTDAAPQERRFQEIPETVSPRATPQLIQVRATRTYQHGLGRNATTPRTKPIILRAIPQSRAIQQTGNTARIQVMLPRHQEHRPDVSSSPAEIIQHPGETESTSGGFLKEQTEPDTKPSP